MARFMALFMAISGIFITPGQAANIALGQGTADWVTATIQPDAADINNPASIWLAATYGNLIYLNDGARWVPYSGGALPIARNATLPASLPVTVDDHIDISGLPGLQFYVGYGANEQDMLTSPGKLAKVYTVPAAGRWVLGFYAGFQRDIYPIAAIDWSSLTHLAVAFYYPKNDGTLDETLNTTNGPALARPLIAAAHQNNRKVIASIGGGDTPCVSASPDASCDLHARWLSATSSGTLPTFVANLKKLVTDYGYDGLDLDWEPILPSDAAAVKALVAALRTALPTAIITLDAYPRNVNDPEDLSLFSQIAGQLDQIHVMTYSMAGIYPGWKSWHSGALYQQDNTTPMSVDASIRAYLNAGVPAAKLGVGVGFSGLCYTQPVTAPLQELSVSTIAASDTTMSYAQIMTTYYSPQAYRYDNAAKAPYLSSPDLSRTTATGMPRCSYISYEDEQSIADKGAYVKTQGLGGAFVWTINEGYLNSQNPLLVALRAAILQ